MLLSLSIAKQSFRETVRQPGYLFALVLEAAACALLILGVHIEYDQGTIVGITFLGNVYDGENMLLLSTQLVNTFAGLILSALMFLFILCASYMSVRMITHPLIPLIIIRDVPRWQYFVSGWSGMVLGVALNVVTCSCAITGILFLKGANHSFALPLASVSFLMEFCAMSSFVALLAALVRNSMAPAVIALAVYFILSPLISTASPTLNSLVNTAGHSFPIIFEATSQTRWIIMGKATTLFPYVIAFGYSAAYLGVGMQIFSRWDIS